MADWLSSSATFGFRQSNPRVAMADPAMFPSLWLVMRTLLVQAPVIRLALLPACSQVTPIASPERTPPPSAVPTATAAPSTPTRQATPTPTPEASPTPEPEPIPVLGLQGANEEIGVYPEPEENRDEPTSAILGSMHCDVGAHTSLTFPHMLSEPVPVRHCLICPIHVIGFAPPLNATKPLVKLSKATLNMPPC
jgi:hypothetical protein